MEIRLIVAVLFAFAVCYVNGQVQSSSGLTAGSVTLTGCNSTKLCMSYNSTCDPSTNSSCFFSSVQVTNQTLTVALSGSTNGFVALGINITNQNQTVTVVFVCGNNSTANTSFFATALNNGTNLIPTNMSTVSNIQGFSNATQGLVQCIFNVTGNLTINYSNGTNTTYNLTMANSTILSIYNGNTSGTDLLSFTQVYTSNTTVNLTMASPSTVATLNITRAGCNSTMLCYSNSSTCDPSGNSSCFFSSIQNNNQTLMFQLSGSSTGYVALGVILGNQTQNSSFVFVCGLNTTSNSSFFQTAVINGTTLTAANTFNVSGYQSTVNVSQSLVQCVFNITTSSITGMLGLVNTSNLTINSTTLTIMNGTTNGTQLGPFSTQFSQTFSLPPPPPPLRFNRTTCGSGKFCLSGGRKPCDPSLNPDCFFTSIQTGNNSYNVELIGRSDGYVALGLANQTATTLFVCGNNKTTSTGFFQTYLFNSTGLFAANVATVYSSQVTIDGSVISCTFNISSDFSITNLRASDSSFNLTIFNGTVSGSTLGTPAIMIATKEAVNISNIAANPTITDNSKVIVSLLINRTNCGSTKLCIAGGKKPCDPSTNPDCFFASIQSVNSYYFFELAGRSDGYVALGLANQTTNTLFVCGNNLTTDTFFFRPYLSNSTGLFAANVTSVYSSQGVMNGNAIWCTFNISSNFSVSTLRASDSSFNLTIANGTVNGSTLGTPAVMIATKESVNISNVTANPNITDNSTVLVSLLINRTNCGSSKLCIAGGKTPCEPTNNPNCFFTSIQTVNNTYFFEVAGRSDGYVALGLANQTTNTLFVCGNNLTTDTFFFRPYLSNSTGLFAANVTSVYSSKGVINGSAIWCTFNISSNFSATTLRASDPSFNLTIVNGTITGSTLGTPAVIIATKQFVNISNVSANPEIIDKSGANSLTHWTQVLAVLLGAMTLHFL